MKRTLRILSVLCLLAVGLAFAVSCKKKDNTPDVIIAGESGSAFSIVYRLRGTTDEELNAAEDLEEALSDAYRSYPELIEDTDTDGTDAYEILIGKTNRPESEAAIEGLNEYGWTVRVIGKKVVINAKNMQFLPDAVQYFMKTYVGKSGTLGIKSISEYKGNQGKYDQPYVISMGTRSVYTVCAPLLASDYLKSSARNMTKTLAEQQGVALSIKEGTAPTGRMITLSVDSEMTGWKILFEENGDIGLVGATDALAVCAMRHFQTEYLNKDADGDILIRNTQTVSDAAASYTRAGWQLAAPAYEGGTLAEHLYDAGTGVQSDTNSPNAERSYVMCVSGTTAEEFQHYKNKLTDCGYTVDSENAVKSSTGENNLFLGFRRGTQYLWTYYLAATGETRVIEDRASSTPESEFEYTIDFDNNTATELYLYGMKYTQEISNGAFQIVKQADGSLFLIDGGGEKQATAEEISSLWAFLQEITQKEKITISCWFITHPHGDHYALVSGLIEKYHDKIDLQRVMFNFPNPTEAVENLTEKAKQNGGVGIDESARKAVTRYFPKAKFLKCHTGQSIRLGSILVDVMTTHEDLISADTGKSEMAEGNSMTTVLRITFADGTRYMELGDFTGPDPAFPGSENRQPAFLAMYDPEEFRCEITSVAHHGYNSLADLYPAIGATYAIWSNVASIDVVDQNSNWKNSQFNTVKGQLRTGGANNQNIFYAGNGTVKLECRNGTVTATQTPAAH